MEDSSFKSNDLFQTHEDVQKNDEGGSSDDTRKVNQEASLLITEKKFDEADTILIDIPKCDRTAEWYYQDGTL